MSPVSAGLASLGVGPGVHVATFMGLSSRWPEVFFGALSLGAIVVPLNLTWTQREVVQGLMLTDSTILIVEARYRGQDLWSLVEKAVPELTASTAGNVHAPQAPTLRSVIALRSEDYKGNVPAYAHDLDLAEGNASRVVDAAHVEPEDPALMLLTSGSTSFPKSAILSHRAVLCGWATYADGLEVNEFVDFCKLCTQLPRRWHPNRGHYPLTRCHRCNDALV